MFQIFKFSDLPQTGFVLTDNDLLGLEGITEIEVLPASLAESWCTENSDAEAVFFDDVSMYQSGSLRVVWAFKSVSAHRALIPVLPNGVLFLDAPRSSTIQMWQLFSGAVSEAMYSAAMMSPLFKIKYSVETGYYHPLHWLRAESALATDALGFFPYGIVPARPDDLKPRRPLISTGSLSDVGFNDPNVVKTAVPTDKIRHLRGSLDLHPCMSSEDLFSISTVAEAVLYV